MIVYMEVVHVGDDDSDYFSFSNLFQAVKYIEEMKICEFNLGDCPILPADDYTFIK